MTSLALCRPPLSSLLNLREPLCAGIRDQVVTTVELKFNCFFLMPLLDAFPGRLREELETAYAQVRRHLMRPADDGDAGGTMGCVPGVWVSRRRHHTLFSGMPALTVAVDNCAVMFAPTGPGRRVRCAGHTQRPGQPPAQPGVGAAPGIGLRV